MVCGTVERGNVGYRKFFQEIGPELVVAIGVKARYDTKDENGETRRERNDKFGESSPLLEIPEAGEYLWNWFSDLSRMYSRTHEGVCRRIPPSEYLAWAEVMGNIVRLDEYAILIDMDEEFCKQMNINFSEYRIRLEEKLNKG